MNLDEIERRNNLRLQVGIYGAEDTAALLARVRQLEAEQVKDLADVDRFRGMARGYMDERDALLADAEAVRAETTRQTDRRIDAYRKLEADNRRLRTAMHTLFAKIEHGDEAHRQWLLGAIATHFGAALGPPRLCEHGNVPSACGCCQFRAQR